MFCLKFNNYRWFSTAWSCGSHVKCVRIYTHTLYCPSDAELEIRTLKAIWRGLAVVDASHDIESLHKTYDTKHLSRILIIQWGLDQDGNYFSISSSRLKARHMRLNWGRLNFQYIMEVIGEIYTYFLDLSMKFRKQFRKWYQKRDEIDGVCGLWRIFFCEVKQ